MAGDGPSDGIRTLASRPYAAILLLQVGRATEAIELLTNERALLPRRLEIKLRKLAGMLRFFCASRLIPVFAALPSQKLDSRTC